VALPGAYAPANINFWVIGARKPPIHDKAVVFEKGCCKYGSGSADYIRGEEFLDQLADGQILKKGISLCSCPSIKLLLLKT
jgi:hypothetical protein